MTVTKNEKQAMSLKVTEGLTVTIQPNLNHEFLMPTKQVALGYGVGLDTLRRHKINHQSELIEGKHFIGNVSITHAASNGSSIGTMWTKRGIVRLGFFIKSERAKLFRDWAEDLVINKHEKPKQAHYPTNAETRLEFKTVLELIESTAVLCGSHNRLAARLGIAPATFTNFVKRPWLVSDKMQQAVENGCRNIIANNNQIDIEVMEALVMVSNPKARLILFNKMKKGGLI